MEGKDRTEESDRKEGRVRGCKWMDRKGRDSGIERQGWKEGRYGGEVRKVFWIQGRKKRRGKEG